MDDEKKVLEAIENVENLINEDSIKEFSNEQLQKITELLDKIQKNLDEE